MRRVFMWGWYVGAEQLPRALFLDEQMATAYFKTQGAGWIRQLPDPVAIPVT